MRKLIAVIIFCGSLFTSKIFAQSKNLVSLSGALIDSAQHLPLSKATILLMDKAGTGFNALSDSAGSFLIKLPAGIYTFTISYSGYKNFEISELNLLHDTTLAPILITQKTGTLQQVTVTHKNDLISQTLDRMTVNVAGSSLSGSNNAFDVLQKTPTVIVQPDGLIMLKGKQVDVWIDGRPTNLTGQDLKNLLSGVPANTIEKIELLSNPSARYDAQSSAIINIVTIKIKKYGTNGSITAGINRNKYTSYNSGININYRKNKINIYGSYNYSKEKEWINWTSDRLTVFSGSSGHITTAEDGLSSSDNNLIKAGIDYTANKRNTFGMLLMVSPNYQTILLQNNTYLGATPSKTDSIINVQNNTKNTFFNPSFNLFYKYNDSTGKDWTTNIDFWNYSQTSHINYENDFLNVITNQARSPYYIRNGLDGKNYIGSFKSDYSQPYKKGRLMAGIKSYLSRRDNNLIWENLVSNVWKIDNGNTNHFIYTENVNSLYLGYEKQVKKFDIQVILRTEQTNITGSSYTLDTIFHKNYLKIFPSVNIDYAVSQKHQLSFSYRKSVNRPPYNYLDPFVKYLNEYNYVTGNPNLQPQIVHSVEISHSYEQSLFTSLSYSRVYNAFSRIFFNNPQNNYLITSYENLNHYNNYSLDISYYKKVLPWWMVTASASLSYASVNTVFIDSAVVNRGFGYFNIISNSIDLSKGYSMDVFLAYSSPYRGTIFKYKGSGFINLGFHIPVLNKKATLNMYISDIFKTTRSGYTTDFRDVQLTYNRNLSSRIASLSFTYRFGNKNVKENSERRTGIETEKRRMSTKD